MATATVPARPRKLHRLERSALTGVLVREIVNFSSYWRSATFSSTVEPTIYLLAFGFGFGSLVGRIGGYRYVEFVGTGTVATAVHVNLAGIALRCAVIASEAKQSRADVPDGIEIASSLGASQ